MFLKDIEKLSENYKNIYIFGHANPDGDSVGATLALARLLKKNNINSKIVLKDVPSTYNFLDFDGFLQKEAIESIDLAIVLDCGDIDRLGDFKAIVQQAECIINIDHHISNDNFGHHNFVRPEASSTSEIVYDMLQDKSLLDKDIAMALYTGIIYDTGVFKHSCTTENTHIIAGSLIKHGFDFTEVINKVFAYKSLTGLKAQSKAIENIEMYLWDKIVVSYLTRNEIQALDITKKHTESIVQMINDIEGVEFAVFIYEMELHEHKVSLRSHGKVDACKIAQSYGGGGHFRASGFSYEGHLSILIQELVKAIEKQLN